MQLYEIYRPKRLAQVVGQDKTIAGIRALMSGRRWDRDALLLIGPTGTGKTSIATALAHELGCGPMSIMMLDGDKCSVEAVRDLERSLSMGSLDSSEGWRVVIVDEAHNMTPRAIQAWLTLLERIPARRLIVFTSTRLGDDLFGDSEFFKPFSGRVKTFKLTNQGLCEPFARLVAGIARREHLDGKPIEAYLKLAKECGNSCRAMLQAVEERAMLT